MADGNIAAMREALEAMLEECCNLCDVPNQMSESGHTCSWRNRWSGCQSKAIDKARAALSAPPRNCDVGDVNEQMQRFESYCNAHEPCESCPLVRPRTTPSCGVHWSQLTYEKEGGAE